MTNYEKIRKACIETDESILELKFGCRVDPKNKALGVGIFIEEEIEKDCVHWKIFYPNMEESIAKIYGRKRYDIHWHNSKPDLNDFEILGREIRLSDVLLAILHHHKFKSSLDYFPQMEALIHPTYRMGELFLDTVWDLLKDNLSEQSEECLSFIASLLPNETEK